VCMGMFNEEIKLGERIIADGLLRADLRRFG
jgi:hypothetical protein